jgi:hypothetical protein
VGFHDFGKHRLGHVLRGGEVESEAAAKGQTGAVNDALWQEVTHVTAAGAACACAGV